MQALVEKDGRYLLVATEWRGADKKYLWFCSKCDKLCVSLWHDVITKKQTLACCFTKDKYGVPVAHTDSDAIAKYETYKVEKKDADIEE